MQNTSLKKRLVLGFFRVTDESKQLSPFVLVFHILLWLAVFIGAASFVPYPFGGLALPLFLASCFGYFKANRGVHEGDSFTEAWEGSFEHKSHPETPRDDEAPRDDVNSMTFSERWLRSHHRYDPMFSENFIFKDPGDE